MRTVITFGTFDVFHIGHLHILNRARKLGDRLVVGVSSDQLNRQKSRVPRCMMNRRGCKSSAR